MSRVLICEPSAKAHGGHYLEYALRISHALKDKCQTIILVNKKFKLIEDSEILIIPMFKYEYFEYPMHQLISKSHKKIIKWIDNLHRFTIAEDFRSFVIMYNTASFVYFNKKLISFIVSIFAIPLAVFVILKKDIELKQIFACALLLLISALILKIASKKTLKLLNALRQKSTYAIQSIANRIGIWLNFFKVKRFKHELGILDSKINLSSSDHLVFTSTSFWDLMGIVNFMSKNSKIINAHIILRREPWESNLTRHNWRYLGKLSSSLPNIRFYTDTTELSELYSDLLMADCVTLPIFVDERELPEEERTFELSYLGDARSEKNFSNFASQITCHPLRDKSVVAQINQGGSGNRLISAQIQRMRASGNIKFIEQPMNSNRYIESFLKSKNIFLNYDSKNYENRSSGIFVEAILWGANPIVSNGSWMHHELAILNSVWHRDLFNTREQKDMGRSISILRNNNILIRVKTTHKRKIQLNLLSNLGIERKLFGWATEGQCSFLVLDEMFPYETKFEVKSISGFVLSDAHFVTIEKSETPYLVGRVALNQFVAPLYTELPIKSSEEKYEALRNFKKFHSSENYVSLMLNTK